MVYGVRMNAQLGGGSFILAAIASTQSDDKCAFAVTTCLRPYHVENTTSRPICHVKQRRAWLVLGSETAWESQVL